MLAAALAAAGCANNEDDRGRRGAVRVRDRRGRSAPTPCRRTTPSPARCSDAIKSDGKLVIGTDPTYEPNEFKDGSGKIVGFDVDLGTAIAKKLGLTAEFQESKFDTILPALGTRYELGMSSFTDNQEREKVVDFVTYFNAGTQWAAKDAVVRPGQRLRQEGRRADRHRAGHRRPAGASRRQCAGKRRSSIQRYDDQAEATNAVVLGKADAVLADSPVMAGAVKKVGGGLKLVGDVYDAAPYGIAIPKNAGTTKEAILGAVKALIADGTYKAILDKWGVAAGAITDPVINGAARASSTGDQPAGLAEPGRRRRRRRRSRPSRSATRAAGSRVAVLAVLVAMLVNGVVNNAGLPLGHRRAVPVRPAADPGGAGHARAHRAGDGARRRARDRAGGDAAVAQPDPVLGRPGSTCGSSAGRRSTPSWSSGA